MFIALVTILFLQIKELVQGPFTGDTTIDILSPCDVKESFSHSRFQARCDMESDGGGWLVIQKRINGSVDFYRNWTDYVYGFGELEGEFWYGLENIHCLTTREDVELRIEVGNETTPSIVWTYQLFQVGGAETNYALTIGEGQGTDGPDSMAHHNGAPFSTRDRDNDARSFNCAARLGGAWWYKYCGHSNLNGKHTYHTPEDGTATSPHYRLTWYDGSSWQDSHYTKAAMKIRPKRAGCGTPSSTC